jgi:hypothetical protein
LEFRPISFNAIPIHSFRSLLFREDPQRDHATLRGPQRFQFPGVEKSMGAIGLTANHAHKPALHEGRGMVAGRCLNVGGANQFQLIARRGDAA